MKRMTLFVLANVRIDSIFSPNGTISPFSGFGEEYTNKIEKVILELKIR